MQNDNNKLINSHNIVNMLGVSFDQEQNPLDKPYEYNNLILKCENARIEDKKIELLQYLRLIDTCYFKEALKEMRSHFIQLYTTTLINFNLVDELKRFAAKMIEYDNLKSKESWIIYHNIKLSLTVFEDEL